MVSINYYEKEGMGNFSRRKDHDFITLQNCGPSPKLIKGPWGIFPGK